MRMGRRVRLIVSVIVPAGFWAHTALAQSAQPAESQTGVVLVKLSPPVYPPLARQARIAGDVEVQVEVRPDGSVASAEAISGHPMLKQAAVESAKNSTYECAGCAKELTPYPLAFTFKIDGECRFGPNCEALEDQPPQTAESQNRVSITVGPLCTCDPAVTLIKARSAKCLYLWRCGKRTLPVE